MAFITASLIGYKKVLNNDKSDHFHSLKIMNSKISRNSFDKCGIEFQINENAKKFRELILLGSLKNAQMPTRAII